MSVIDLVPVETDERDQVRPGAIGQTLAQHGLAGTRPAGDTDEKWPSRRGHRRDTSGGPCIDPVPPVRLDRVTDGSSTLSERDQAIIRFESSWFTLDEHRYDAIRSRFACSIEEYNLEVNRLIDEPAALEFDPLTVRRLRRHRERRRREMIEGAASGD
jgi:hypothetical protein